MDLKLELVALRVSDVDRVKDFYVERVGFTPTLTSRSTRSSGSLS